MNRITIKEIPNCFAYTAEYDVKSLNSFFNLQTGENILYDLQYMMEKENPNVQVPDLGEDYNFFEYPMDMNNDGNIHVIYFDMVDKKGIDNADGAYRFVDIAGIKAATLIHRGSFEEYKESFDILYEWIKNNGYEIAGKGRASAIHGPWDRESEADYETELQVPIK